MPPRPARSRLGAPLAATAAATLLLGLVGCAPDTDSAEGRMGLPVLGWLPDAPIGDTAIQGTLRTADNGCFLLDTEDGSYFVVWPDGFEHGGPVVVTDDGSELGDGDPVRGVGTVLDAGAAIEAGGGDDSQLGVAIGYCAEDGEDVAFLAKTTAR